MKNRFHCCATCIHFQANKTTRGMVYYCERLGYETKPTYVFNCWEPKEHVLLLMSKKGSDKK
ncbi:hypothetical protein [Bacillus spongiae]